MPAGKHDYDLETFFPLFSKCIYNLITDLPTLRTTTLSALHSFASDGVIYLELRTTPRAIPSTNITKDLYISTILSTLHAHNTTSPMHSRLLISIDRRNTPAQAAEALALALKYRDRGVVGLDLCGDPSKGDISIFAPVFQRAKEEGLGIALHFAEMGGRDEEELEVLLGWGPDRLGHVIHVKEGMRREILRRGVGVELCLSCNVLAKMMRDGTEGYGDHHFGWWWREGGGRGIAVSVSFLFFFFFFF
ncbi:hypothetical protein HYFRA_00009283 [Hymenoscyphus fraxineus]|uniref:Adenosine deaminase domain-containing protein n=1 Tax=Hymenoscyphus fraxineus TaxID=746836 RepID=A0A9N9PWY1_9HELO|nr:hypothetical protein HYFRA_00009283 [Hymenoscyphus fraxineus]